MGWRPGVGGTKDGGEEDDGKEDSEDDVEVAAAPTKEQTTNARSPRRACQDGSWICLQTTVSGEAGQNPRQPRLTSAQPCKRRDLGFEIGIVEVEGAF